MQKTKINSFQKLNAWQKSHSATLIIYGLTKEFPLEETYGLSRQMRRAAVSVGSNIAEGFNRRSQKEKAHFYQMGVASIGELQRAH